MLIGNISSATSSSILSIGPIKHIKAYAKYKATNESPGSFVSTFEQLLDFIILHSAHCGHELP